MLLSAGAVNQSTLIPCPACHGPLQVETFPALFRQNLRGELGTAALMDDESTCFNHPEKQAVIPCQNCGRFLCALCDCELGGEHFCPSCLEAGRTTRKIKSLENQRTLYDSIALTLAIAPIFTIYFTLITAPMSLYVAIRHWNAPRSIVHPTRARSILAIIIASLQVVGWVSIFILLYSAYQRRNG
jgi:hypothetical protein